MRHLFPHIFGCIALLWASAVCAQEVAPNVPTPLPADGPECAEYVTPEEREDPKRLVLRGVACFEDGEYLLALEHYRKAREFSDANLLNAAIGRTFQELGHPFIARRYYRDYLDGPIEEGQGRAKIEQRLQAVESQLEEEGADVTVKSSPPGAEVHVVVEDSHWEPLGATPLTVRMLPGKHRFIVQRDGFVSQTHDVTVVASTPRTVDAALVDADALFGLSGRSLQRTGVILAGISLPVIATGVSLIFVGKNRRTAGEELFGEERDSEITAGSRLEQVGIVGTVVGVTMLGTGITVYLVGVSKASSGPESENETAWKPAFYVSPTGVGARFVF